MYVSPIRNVVAAHSLCHHQYADDTQLYTAVRPCADANFKSVSMCVEDVARWFLENGLLLNPTKTEAVLFGTRVQHDKIQTASGIDVAGTVVPFRDTVKLLGVTLDSALTMDLHVTEVIRSCNYHTHCGICDHCWHSTSPTRSDIVLWHRGWTTPTHYCTARRPATLTGCRWLRTHWL